MADLEPNDADKATRAALLKQTIASDPFPMSPRICTLRLILAKLQPPTARPQPFPAPTRTGVPSHVLHRNRQR
jgi:hypothetical protein